MKDQKDVSKNTHTRNSHNAKGGSHEGTSRNSQDNPRSNRGNKKPNSQKGLAASANDVRWYSKDAELLKGAASISSLEPFGIRRPNYVTGLKTLTIAGADKGNLENNYSEGASTFGSITAMYLSPTGCGQWKATDAINIAATHLYTFVRHANSGSKNYEKADLMIYCLAMAQIYSYCGWVSRLLGTLGYYQKGNRDIPESLINAMLEPTGYSVSLTQTSWDEIAQMRTWFNSYINKINTLAVPNSIPLFERAYWMYSNIYTSTKTWKKDIYFYNPEYFLFYHPTILETGGALLPLTMEITSLPGVDTLQDSTLFEVIRAIGDSLIYHVFGDDDMSIMSGDILKAYGAGNLFTIAQVPVDYVISPTVDEEVILQFHNARIINTISTWNTNDQTIIFTPETQTGKYTTLTTKLFAIFQENNLIQDFQLSGFYKNPTSGLGGFPDYSLPFRYTLDLPQDEFSPELVTTSTRLTYAIVNEKPEQIKDTFMGYVLHCDFWLPTRLKVSRLKYTLRNGYLFEEFSLSNGNTLSISDITESDNPDLALALFGEHMPIINLVAETENWSGVDEVQSYSEFSVPTDYINRINTSHNFIYVSEDTLDRINDVCILSELDIPHKY